jgi:CubicO group peptidase (beta-lactamase class C family)
LGRFAIALQKGVLLKPETIAQMSRSAKTRDGKATGYGYGWYIDGRAGRAPDGSISHGGVQAGFTADLWISMNKRLAIVSLANLEGGGILGLADLANQIEKIMRP